MSEVAAAPTCDECGFGLYSDEHMRGVGLHGHTRTSDEEANAQRADVMARAYAFADEQTAAAAEAVATATSGEKPLNRMNRTELASLAEYRGFEVHPNATVAQLREALSGKKES